MIDSLGNKLPKNAFIIRATEVTAFRNCRRKWFFESHNGKNLEPIVKDPKLRFGECWHKALEDHYSNDKDKSWITGFYKQVSEEEERLMDTLGDGFFDEGVQQQLQDEKELAELLLPLYEEWSIEEAEPSDNDLQILEAEKRLLIPIPSPSGKKTKAWLAVKLDAVAKDEQEHLWGYEHKTMSKSSNVTNPDTLPLDLQMGLQLWALQAACPDSRVQGAIYNLMRKQKPSKRVKNPIFGRHRVRRSPTELDNLIKDLYNDYTAMRQAVRDPQARFYNPQVWSGMCVWGCKYRDVCEAMNGDHDYQGLLEANFKPRDKDIWQVLEEEMYGK